MPKNDYNTEKHSSSACPTQVPIDFVLTLPPELSLESVMKCARILELTPDEFISRCVVSYATTTIEQLESGEPQRWIEAGTVFNVDERIDRCPPPSRNSGTARKT